MTQHRSNDATAASKRPQAKATTFRRSTSPSLLYFIVCSAAAAAAAKPPFRRRQHVDISSQSLSAHQSTCNRYEFDEVYSDFDIEQSRLDGDQKKEDIVAAATRRRHDHDSLWNRIHRGGTKHDTTSSSKQGKEYGTLLIREMRKSTGSFFAATGFLSSTLKGLYHDRAQFRRWQPTVDSLQGYLKTSGIDLEFSKAFTRRLFGNLIILSRVQKAALGDMDRRDQAASFGGRQRYRSNQTNVPDMEEASR